MLILIICALRLIKLTGLFLEKMQLQHYKYNVSIKKGKYHSKQGKVY